MDFIKGLRGRLMLLGFVPVLLFILLTIFYILPSMKSDIYSEKELQTKEFVNIGMSTVEMFYQMEQSGELSRQEAQDRAIQVIKNIRFGETMADYFWINDDHPRMIMHPFRPDLEGEDLSGFQDPDGLHMFSEFVNVAKRDGAGYVPYQWQYYSETERIEPKLSYVTLFEPWGWIIGTGIYVNDVDDIIQGKMITTISYIFGIIVVTSLIIFIFAHYLIIKPLDYAVKVGERMAEGDFTDKIDEKIKNKEDEISRLLNVFGHINKNMEVVLGNVLSNSDRIYFHSNQLKTSIEKTNESLENTVVASQSLLEAAASQKAGANESSTAIEEMALGINHIADSAVSINDYSIDLVDQVDDGKRIVTEAISKMKEIKEITKSTNTVVKQLNDDSREVGSILALISGVAEQTNLLALNAAIEAARVGEQGKGFAVVADEIRKLANDTADSVGRVGAIIDGVASKTEEAVKKTLESTLSVDEGIENVQKVEEMFKAVLKAQEEISKQIAEMTSITEEMSAGAEELTATVSNFSHSSEMTSDNAQNILDVSRSQSNDMMRILEFARELDEMSNSLKALVGQFKIK